jgi:methionyl-tRNA synthetase
VRYFLLRGISAHEDGDFSEEKFKALYNADLANGIGNLVARVSALGEKAGAIEIQNRSKLFDIKESLRASDLLSDFRFNEVLEKIWDEVRAVDKRINDEKPWEKRGEGLSRAVADYSTAILRIAHALQPFLPETAKNIQSQFRIQGNTLLVKKAEPLFRRLP